MRPSPSLLCAAAALLAAGFVQGCKKGPDLVSKTGEALGEKITDFTKGVGKGIDQGMTVNVSLAPEAMALGLTSTIGKSLGLDSPKKGISVYLIAEKDVAAILKARAYNGKGVEIGRALKQVSMIKGDAGYMTFEFEAEMDTASVHRYIIGL